MFINILQYIITLESLFALKEKMKLGQFVREMKCKPNEEQESTKATTVGAHCEVTAPKAPPRRGAEQ